MKKFVVDNQTLKTLKEKVPDLHYEPTPKGSKRAFRVGSMSLPWWALKKMIYNIILAAKEIQLSHRA